MHSFTAVFPMLGFRKVVVENDAGIGAPLILSNRCVPLGNLPNGVTVNGVPEPAPHLWSGRSAGNGHVCALSEGDKAVPRGVSDDVTARCRRRGKQISRPARVAIEHFNPGSELVDTHE